MRNNDKMEIKTCIYIYLIQEIQILFIFISFYIFFFSLCIYIIIIPFKSFNYVNSEYGEITVILKGPFFLY